MNDHETDLAAPQLLVSGASLGHYANVPFKVGETCSQLKLKKPHGWVKTPRPDEQSQLSLVWIIDVTNPWLTLFNSLCCVASFSDHQCKWYGGRHLQKAGEGTCLLPDWCGRGEVYKNYLTQHKIPFRFSVFWNWVLIRFGIDTSDIQTAQLCCLLQRRDVYTSMHITQTTITKESRLRQCVFIFCI